MLSRLAALLGLARIGLGVAVWTAPRASVRVLGFDPESPQVLALARLAGTRDLALGAAAVAAADDPVAAATITRLNAGVDALDALAFAIPLARRRGIDRAGLMGTLSGVSAAIFGVLLADRLEAGSEGKEA